MERRTFLGAVGGGVWLGSLPGGMLGRTNTTSTGDRIQDLSPTFEISHPTDVIDTFLNVSAAQPYLLGRSGWEDLPDDEKMKTVRRLHAEKLDMHTNLGGNFTPSTTVTGGPATEGGHFAEDVQLPAGGQQLLLPNEEGFNRWYQQRPAEDRWTRDDGTVIEGASDFAAREYEGGLRIGDTFGNVWPTLFFDQYREYMAANAETFVKHGYSHVYLDTVIRPTWDGLDFSEWAKSAFREHLQSLSASRLDDLGVSDPGSFDVFDHFEQNGLGPGDVDTPFADPVAREFKRFQFHAHRDYAAAYRRQIHEAFPERSATNGISVVGNVNLEKLDPTPIVIADAFDAVHGESKQTVPPDRIVDWKYKLGYAAGRFERQVVSVGSMIAEGGFSDPVSAEFDPKREYPTLQNIQVAEGFATGGMRSISMAGWGMNEDWAVDNWTLPDGSVPEPLQAFLDFCWAHRPFLEDSIPVHDVVLVYSLPTAFWQRAPQWGRYHPEHARSFEGLAALLRRHQLPYDVLVFGLPGVWEDDDQLARLEEYRTVVLPDVTAISDAQATALLDIMENGVEVVATGGGPRQNHNRQPLSDFPGAISEHPNGTVVDTTPGRSVQQGNEPQTDLEGPLTAAGRQVLIDASGVVATVRQQPEQDRNIIHFLNYEYSRESDSVPVHRDVEVSVSLPTDPTVARWIAPTGSQPLDIVERDGRYEVTLPRVRVWGMLVLATDQAALVPGDRDAANTEIEAAREAVQTADEEERRHLGFTRAEAELANAEAAMDHDGFRVAQQAAERARMEAESAKEVPVVGIDQAHGQGGRFDWDAFRPLRDQFSRYRYRDVSNWSREVLASLDTLIVPPVQDGAYDFKTEEIEVLDAFVNAGGSVVILGNPGMVDDVSMLTDRYGFRFDGGLIAQPESFLGNTNSRIILARGRPSTLTQYAISFRTSDATPVVVDNDAVETLAFVHEGMNAFVDRTDSPEERNSADEPAEGLPLVVATARGDGYVAGIGTAEPFLAPTQGEDGGRTGQHDDALVTSVLRSATAGEVTLESTDGPDTGTSSTTENTSRTEDTTGVGGPGFGIAAAVAGIGGYALKRLLDDQADG